MIALKSSTQSKVSILFNEYDTSKVSWIHIIKQSIILVSSLICALSESQIFSKGLQT